MLPESTVDTDKASSKSKQQKKARKRKLGHG